MAKLSSLENFTADRMNLIRQLVSVSNSVDREYVWFYELIDHLKKNGFELGDYFMEGGEDNVLRRIKLQTGKGLNEIVLNLMKERGISKAEAGKVIESIKFKDIKKVPEIKNLGSLLDDIVSQEEE